MSAASHTPGPWIYDGVFGDPGTGLRATIRAQADLRAVCKIDSFKDSRSERAEDEANARLIAAAPELLERLHSAVEQLEALNGAYALNAGDTEATQVIAARAREVIAKAEGHQ